MQSILATFGRKYRQKISVGLVTKIEIENIELF